jgi:hypothetical protein
MPSTSMTISSCQQTNVPMYATSECALWVCRSATSILMQMYWPFIVAAYDRFVLNGTVDTRDYFYNNTCIQSEMQQNSYISMWFCGPQGISNFYAFLCTRFLLF